jgi:hypothetical protein
MSFSISVSLGAKINDTNILLIDYY